MNQLVEDLQAAREIVVNNWCSHGLTTNGQDACIMGALNKAIAGSVFWQGYTEAANRRRNRAESQLSKYLPEGFTFGLASFNDRLSTTHEDVVNLFDKTLADLGGL